MLKEYLKSLIRKRNPVLFNELQSIKPVSSVFGMERGTPIDRYYIEHFLKMNMKEIKGKILEVGNNIYTKKYSQGNSFSEILNYEKNMASKGLNGDLTNIETLKENEFDCFVCTQTLNFIYHVSDAVRGIYYLLKPTGTALITVSGISQISRYDMERWGDYWRFTNLSIRKLFETYFAKNQVEIFVYGNLFSSIAFLQGISVEDIPDMNILDCHDPDYQLIIGVKAVK